MLEVRGWMLDGLYYIEKYGHPCQGFTKENAILATARFNG